jgi:hypothetical protein
MSSKIVIKKPTSTASASLPKASAVVAVPSKVVVAAPSKVVVKAPAKKVVTPTKKIVQEEVEEVQESEEEGDATMSRDEMLSQALTLLSQALGMKGSSGSGKIKLTKSGKIRKPRGPRENSEKQSAWMEFVKQVREEQGVDESGKFVISHKDAMKMAKQLRAETSTDVDDEAEEETAPAPKKVVAKKAAVTTKKSPQQIREELIASKAKKAAEEAAAEAEVEVEVEEFEHKGKNYLKNTDNLCWLVDEEGNQTWAGVFLPEEDRIDESVEEPTA